MPTRRTPLNRKRDLVITQEMLDAFRDFVDAPHPHRWKEPHNKLMDLITDRPFPYPIVLPPDQPYDGCPGREDFDEARQNWDQLMAALEAEEARTERKRKLKAKRRVEP
ncbi:MAG: hypothetical protein WBX49_00415 [Candidatus Deferrimicrobiaceae bacterium]